MMSILTRDEQAELDHAYAYHKPTELDLARMDVLREAAKAFEAAVMEHCPPSADRSAARRQIRDARMTANRSIALNRG